MEIAKKSHLLGHRAAIYALHRSKDCEHFFTGSGDGWLVKWQLSESQDGQLVAQIEDRIFAIAAVPSVPQWLVGGMSGDLFWIDAQGTLPPKRLQHHRQGLFALLLAETYLYSAGGDGVLTKWSLEKQLPLESLQLSHTRLRTLAKHPHLPLLAVGASDGHIYFVDLRTFTLKNTLSQAHDSSVFSLTYSLDGNYLYSGGRDAHLCKWQTTPSPQLLEKVPAHWFTINDMALSPDGKYLTTVSRDKTVKIWLAAGSTLKLVKVLDTIRNKGHLNSVNKVIWLSNTQFVTTGDDRSLIVWEVAGA